MAANRYTPMGYAQDTSIDTASALPSIPDGATVAVIRVSTQDVRIRDDGTDPTTSVGFPIAAGDTYTYEGDLAAVKIIASTAGAAIAVLYYT